MGNNYLHRKRVMRIILFILLLGAVGMTKAMAQTNTYTPASAPIRDTIKAKTVGIIPYSDDFITQEEVMDRYYSITSFRMIDTATVAVLTGASDMILVYSLNQNQILRKIQLPISARAFEYDNNLFHVIGDRTYLTIDSEGMIHERKDFQQPNKEFFAITDLKLIEGQPIIHESDANTYSLIADALQEIDTFYCDHARGFKMLPKYLDESSFILYNETPSRSGRLNVSMESLGLEGKLACLDYISVDDDFIAINLQTTYNRTGSFIKSYLLVVNLNGELINLVEVPINFLSYIHKPFLYKDNAWYYAFSGQEGVFIFKIGTDTNSIDSPDSYEPSDESIDYFYREHENGISHEDTDNNDSTRGNWRTITQAWYNGHQYCSLEWTPTSSNLPSECTYVYEDDDHYGNIKTPSYLTVGSTTTGVPYSWGGFTRYNVFKDKANNGKYTGNKRTKTSDGCNSGHVYVAGSDSYVIGVDCSGFVSNCWEVSRHTTKNISDICSDHGLVSTASTSDFQKGDALNDWGSHVMLYTGHNRSGSFNVFESSSWDWKTSSRTYETTFFNGTGYRILRYNDMKNIILRLNSAITMRQNGSIVTTVTRGVPLTVNYSVKNFGSETWVGYVQLYIEQSDGDVWPVGEEHYTILDPNDWQSFEFSNDEVISPVGTTKFYVKVKNYNAGGYDGGRYYDVGGGGYGNPLVFEIVEGGGGGGSTSCKSCPDYDEVWGIAGNGDWYYKSSSIDSDGCRIYKLPLYSNYTYTFQTCDPGTASFDTWLYLLDANCNYVDDDDDGCGTNGLSSLQYTNTGNSAVYYLKIVGYNGAGGSFTIAGKRESQEPPVTCKDCPDYDESWNVNNVEVGEWTTKSSSIGTDGCRIYRVPLMPYYTYTFQTGCDNGDANFDTRLYLYDASCDEVAYNDDGCSNHLSSIKYRNTTGSTAYYYLKIDGYDGEGGSYTIAAKRETCSSCPEYDESWSVTGEDWTYKSSGIVSGGCSIYRVQLRSNYTYTFQTGCGHGDADFDTQLYLYDSSCDIVAEDDDGCSNLLSSLVYTNTGSTAYYYLKIKGFGSASGSYTIAAKRENPVVNYVIDVSASPSSGGTVGGAGTYQSGSTCTITASPNTGYNFVQWTKNGSLVSTNASYSFTVTENASYVAVFSLNSYTISASASPSAGGSVSGMGSYNYGSTCTLTANPATGYSFVRWTKNGNQVSTNPSYSFTVTENASYVAVFSLNSYTISASASPNAGGSVSGTGSYNYGSTCTLTATPATGYSFVRWTKNGSQVSTNPSYSFTVTENASYVAVFSLNSYTISASANPSAGGTVNGAGTYNYGSSCTLIATPASGYSFVRWTKNGSQVSTNPSYSFTVTGNASYVAIFSLNSFTITASASPSTGGSVSGAGSYNYGSTCTLIATPATGYSFVRWTKNGNQVSTNPSFSFTVTGNASYVAVFEQSPITQNQTLSTGWNWWSSYVELNGAEGLSMLENGLGSAGQMIKSRSDGYVESYTYNGATGWFGSLTSISNEQMYKINMNSSSSTAVTGYLVSTSNHPIAIGNGWNWIGFPLNQSVGVAEALSGFSPAVDDVLKGRNSYTTYFSNNGTTGWFGSLNTLEPGYGYMYQSQSSGTKTLVFQPSRGEVMLANITPENNIYQPSDQRFADNMTVTAVIEVEDEELRSDSHELAAFVDGECRGSVRLLYVEPIDRYVAFLTVFGETGDALEFRLTDGTDTQFSTDMLSFASDGGVGTLALPKVLHFGTLGLGENSAMVRIYPNPVRRKGTLNVSLPEASGTMTVEIGNMLGVTVLREEVVMDPTSVVRISLPDAVLSGTYILKAIRADGNVYYGKLVVE